MSFPIRPIYLLADSQLLFQPLDGVPLLAPICGEIESERPKGAYIGASNGDDPVFYSIFEGAMDVAGIPECRMITSAYTSEDRDFLNEADLILLAGGDVARGWDVLDGTDMRQDIIQRYYGGAILVGISAGAIQLGLGGRPDEKPADEDDLIETFKLIPFYIDAHDEGNKWQRLKKVVSVSEGFSKGIGIPKGGGMIYHPDHALEPVRQPLIEFAKDGDDLTETLLFPGSEEERDGDDAAADR
ncbi:MAG: Type 1 glutamine amidotransferase-like domain-containing protein [Acidobacteriota bacterium]|nr:Type 1 glutamine amidotransferase-like domain-containing protein [Acidobacteriota bacterium]